MSSPGSVKDSLLWICYGGFCDQVSLMMVPEDHGDIKKTKRSVIGDVKSQSLVSFSTFPALVLLKCSHLGWTIALEAAYYCIISCLEKGVATS